MEDFVYRPRKVVSIKTKDKIRKARGYVKKEGQGEGVVTRGRGWAGRVETARGPIFTQIYKDYDTALEARQILVARLTLS